MMRKSTFSVCISGSCVIGAKIKTIRATKAGPSKKVGWQKYIYYCKLVIAKYNND